MPVLALLLIGAGYYVGDIGTAGMARGGAYVAAPESLLAIHYNPAGLSYLHGLQLEVDVSLLNSSLEFDRACPCVDGAQRDAAAIDEALEQGFASAHATNQVGPRPIPFIAAGYGFDTLDLTIALAAYGPHGTAYSFGDTSFESARLQPQRYSIIESNSVEANYQLGFALSPIDRLRLGGTITAYQTQSEQALHVYANTVLTPAETSEFDVPITVEFERPAALDWSLGAIYELFDELRLGASVRGKRSVRADGQIYSQTPEVLQDFVEIQDGPAQVELDLPPIVRAGAEFRQPGLFRVEGAVVYEAWSVHDQIVIRADEVKLVVQGEESSLGEMRLERGWRDTFSLRLGADIEVLSPDLGIRVGYFFEPSAIPSERLQPSAFDLDKHGLGLGLESWIFDEVVVRAAISHVILMDTQVRDSAVMQPAPLDPPFGTDERLTRIANGDYSGSFTIASIGLGVSLDDL